LRVLPRPPHQLRIQLLPRLTSDQLWLRLQLLQRRSQWLLRLQRRWLRLLQLRQRLRLLCPSRHPLSKRPLLPKQKLLLPRLPPHRLHRYAA
jgi:hypothetical protein